MVDLGENRRGLSSKEYEGVWTKGFITGDVIVSVFTGKNGKSFDKYAIPVQLLSTQLDVEITNLVRGQLNRLVLDYGSDTKQWFGRPIAFTAVEDGKYLNWELYPELPVNVQKVK